MSGISTARVEVEIVLATSSRQILISVDVPEGSTVADVIAASRVEQRFPDIPVAELAVGIWGRVVERDHPVRKGDRVEIYRPLRIDPREARRQLALAGRTMGRTPPVTVGPRDSD